MPINISVSTESVTQVPKQERIAYTKEFAKIFAFCAMVSVSQYLLPVIAAYMIDSESITGIGYGILTLGSLYGFMSFIRLLSTGYNTLSKEANDEDRYWSSFVEISIVSIILGVLIIIFKDPTFHATMLLTSSISDATIEYYNIAVWASPVHLLNFGIIGWLMAHKRFKETFFIYVFGSFFMIFSGSTFIPVWGLGAKGIAVATIVSQVILFIIGLSVVLRIVPKEKRVFKFSLSNLKKNSAPIFIAGFYLLLRTLFLITQMNIEHSMVRYLDEPFLSANNILVQLLFFTTSIFQGVATAATIFIARAIVRKNSKLTKFTFKLTNYFTIGVGVIISVLFFVFREPFINYYAHTEQIAYAAIIYSLWIMAYFLLGGFSMTYCGLFVGAMKLKPIILSIGVSIIVFVFVYYVANEVLLQLQYSTFDAIWMASSAFYVIRGIVLFLKRDLIFNLVPDTDDIESEDVVG